MDLFGEGLEHKVQFEAEIREIFDKIDVDGSGFIDKDEFLLAIQNNVGIAELVSKSKLLAGLVLRNELEEAFNAFDVDRGGTVSFDEFWNFAKNQADEQKILELFNLINVNQNDSITVQELKNAFSTNTKLRKIAENSKIFGKIKADEDWSKLLDEMNTDTSHNATDEVNFVEFWHWCRDISAQVQMTGLYNKALARTERIEKEKRILNQEYLKRLNVHVSRNGAQEGGVFTTSIAPDLFSFPHLPACSNPFLPAESTDPAHGLDQGHAANPFLTRTLRGMTFVRKA